MCPSVPESVHERPGMALIGPDMCGRLQSALEEEAGLPALGMRGPLMSLCGDISRAQSDVPVFAIDTLLLTAYFRRIVGVLDELQDLLTLVFACCCGSGFILHFPSRHHSFWRLKEFIELVERPDEAG